MENVALAPSIIIIIMMIMCKQTAINFVSYIIFGVNFNSHIHCTWIILKNIQTEGENVLSCNGLNETIKKVFAPIAFGFVSVIGGNMKCFRS